MKLIDLSKANLKATIKNTLLVIIGTMILSFGTSIFVLPHDLIIGGVSGIGIIFDNVFEIAYLSEELVITVLTWLLFFIGWIILGKNFAMQTLVSSIVFPTSIMLFNRLRDAEFFSDYRMVEGDTSHLVISVVFYGILGGIGCALTYIGGGSTGGSDIIGLIIAKFCKKLKSAVAIGIVDASIVVLGIFALKNIALSLYGILAVCICTVVIDKVFIGTSQAFVAEIITMSSAEITQAVITRLERTTTIMNVVGGYSGEEHKLVMVSFSMRQYSTLMSIINQYDKTAFVTIHRAHEINGEGWTR